MMICGKQGLRERLARLPADAAERAAIDDCVDRMSSAQAEDLLKRMEFADTAAIFIISEIDRLFVTEPATKGEKG